MRRMLIFIFIFVASLNGLLAILLRAETAVASPTATITVNSAGDEPDGSGGTGSCLTLIGGCTLRAAIETAQAQAGPDVINFSGDFTINLGSALPVLSVAGLTIDGVGHTVRINAGNGNFNVFRINGEAIALKNLRLYGSGSSYSNIWLQTDAVEVEIANNIIGDDNPGTGGCGNSNSSFGGIYVASNIADETKPTAWIYGNTIKCHVGLPGEGISIFGSQYVMVGVDPLGNATAVQQNSIHDNNTGIAVTSNAQRNQIRNNHIFNNSTGIQVNGSGRTSIWANIIENNTNYGVELVGGTAVNFVGCNDFEEDDALARNYIRGNASAGVYVTGVSSEFKYISCNWIGTDSSGTTAAPNNYGIYVTGDAPSTWVINNLLSGNTLDGLRIQNSGGSNLIMNNIIGLDHTGMLSLPNGQHGIGIFDDAGNNIIGSTLPVATGNIIGSNTNYGILISNSPTTTLDLNKIGVAIDGVTPRGNGFDGLHVSNSTGTKIGTLDFPGTQIIAHNGESGIYLENVQETQLVTNTLLLNNDNHGLYVFQSQGNYLTPQQVQGNGAAGIRIIGNSSINNLMIPQEIDSNGGLPIELGADGLELNDPGDADTGPNGLLNYPEVTTSSGTVVTGTTTAGTFVISIYEVTNDPTKPGGGGILRGSKLIGGADTWSVDLADYNLQNRPVAFVAHWGSATAFDLTSSPLSPVTQLGYELFLPAIVKN
ncbi:MAG: right-handed parallel beta-helix repeat-containing protein [Candidatus Promineifilaceae bacterium]